MSFLDSVIDVLESSGKTMHVTEVAEAMLTRRLVEEADPESIAQKVSTSLAQHVRSNNPRVAKIKNGQGGYKKGFYRIKKQIVKAPVLPSPEVGGLTTNFLGKAGEYAVMSELLFWGFNVSLMAVDEGIDVIATKDNKYFHIQVKTTGKPNANGQYAFSIRREAFDQNNSAHIFYILVMREGASTRYVVLPSTEIVRLIRQNHISDTPNLSIRIAQDPASKQYMLNSRENAQPWINAFHVIK